MLEADKISIVEKTKSLIEELKDDNSALIDKIEMLTSDKEKIDNEKFELIRKSEEIHKKSQENYLLKNEIEKTKNGFKREKNRLEISKDKEINHLAEQLKYANKFEKELSIVKLENCKLKNSITELKSEIKKINTVFYSFNRRRIVNIMER